MHSTERLETLRDRPGGAGAAANDGWATDAERPLTDAELESDVRTLSAVGHRTRYEVLRTLAAVEGEVCACDLESRLPVSQSTISRALQHLRAAGLASRRKDGRWRYYGVTDRATTLLQTLGSIRGATAPEAP